MGGALQSFTKEDLLQAIKAAFEAATSSPPKKRRSNPDNEDTVQQHHSKTAQFRQTHSLSHIVLKVCWLTLILVLLDDGVRNCIGSKDLG